MVAHARALKRALMVGGLVGLAAAFVVWAVRREPASIHPSWPIPGEDGVRIEVEVLNGAGVDGLARLVTTHLRRAGIDVVSFGTAGTLQDATRLLVRRGDSTSALAVQRALGQGRIEIAPDPRRLLDVSVLLGADAIAIGRDP